MRNKLKPGALQLAIIALFVVASFSLSKILENDTMESQSYTANERLLYAKTQLITPGNYNRSFYTTGTVEAMHEVSIVPQVSGRIVWVNDKLFKGEAFDQDEPLFEIDRSDYDIDVIKTESDLAKASTALDIELAEAKASLEEWKNLNAKLPATDLVLRKPQLKEAQAFMKSALAQKEKARLNLSRTIFKLPFAGKVISSDISEGQFVMSGQAYGKVYNNALLEVHSSLSDAQMQVLFNSSDAVVDIEINSYGVKKIYKGHVKRSATFIDKSTRFANIRFAFDEADKYILVGSFAKVSVQGSELKNISVIPRSSMQKDGKILIVNEDNIISKIKPIIVQIEDDNFAISGINGEYRIVVDSMPSAIEGMQVIIDLAQ